MPETDPIKYAESDPLASDERESRSAAPAERLAESQAPDLFSESQETSEIPDANSSGERPRRKRRIRLPVILFLLTCASTFWAGATNHLPLAYVESGLVMRQAVVAHWQDGLIYLACVLGILMTHELGHFIATLIYRIPASYPFFLPLPISPIGTLGAVIGMDGMRANRKEIFDIGIAGPIAGLVVATPIMWVGVQQVDLTQPASSIALEIPLAMRWLLDYLQPTGYTSDTARIGFNHLNPYLMAGWVALLVTGLNMLPVGQLDGGHVGYTLFGRYGHWMARSFLVLWIAYTVYSGNYGFLVMTALLVLVGPDHPPTRDDTVPIGYFRFALGLTCMFIPVVSLMPPFITV